MGKTRPPHTSQEVKRDAGTGGHAQNGTGLKGRLENLPLLLNSATSALILIKFIHEAQPIKLDRALDILILSNYKTILGRPENSRA